MTLIDRILALADLWSAANGHRSTSRLSTKVANDGGLLKRLAAGGGATVASLDKFALYLREPGNWPGEVIPIEGSKLLDAIGHIATLPDDANARAALARTADAARRVA